MPENSNPDPAAIILALMAATTESLGDFANGKILGRTRLIIGRQIEALAALDGRFAEAFRDYVHDRVRRFVPDDESVEKVLTNPTDPTHAYWIAIIPRNILRTFCAQRVAPPPSMQCIGTIVLPAGMRPPELDSEDGD